MLNVVTLTVIPSIFLSILASIIFFLFGYSCRGWRQRCKRSESREQTTSEANPQNERVVPNATTEHQVDLKLTRNEAYASLNIELSHS